MFLLTEAFSVFFFSLYRLHAAPNLFLLSSLNSCTRCDTMLPKAWEPVFLYHSRNGVIGFCGLLCSRLHVMMSWVLNVSVTRHDKLSQHPRRHLYTSVIDDYTAWLIHFKTLLYGNLWHSFRLPSPCRGTVDFKCHSNITCVCVCQFVCTTLFKVIQLRSRHLSKIMLHC